MSERLDRKSERNPTFKIYFMFLYFEILSFHIIRLQVFYREISKNYFLPGIFAVFFYRCALQGWYLYRT